MYQMESQNTHQISFSPTPKQHKAWQILNDKTTNVLYYGGAAGGGKTYLACAWIIIQCLNYPGTRWFIGRDTLTSIKKSTLNTFFDIANEWELSEGIKYNAIEGTIKFWNDSEIYLMDLHHNPTDPNFDRLGSMEFTGGFLEEVAEVSLKAYEIIKSRIRYKLTDFDLIPKILIASNPTKNWVYKQIYKPYKNGTLPDHTKFIQAFSTDNDYLSGHYTESLKQLNKLDRERLLEGNFEYDESDAALFDFDAIQDAFTIDKHVERSEDLFISCDVARKGSDKAVIILWSGFRAEKIFTWDTSKIDDLVEAIKELSELFNVPRTNIVIDSDGVGGGVVDYLPGCKEFVNNAQAFKSVRPNQSVAKPENYSNLKSQCYFYLAEMVNNRKIFINATELVRDEIEEELEQIRQKDPDKDGKLAVEPKDKIKERLSRSPDFADALMMRMFFEVKPHYGMSVSIDEPNVPDDAKPKYGFTV